MLGHRKRAYMEPKADCKIVKKNGLQLSFDGNFFCDYFFLFFIGKYKKDDISRRARKK